MDLVGEFFACVRPCVVAVPGRWISTFGLADDFCGLAGRTATVACAHLLFLFSGYWGFHGTILFISLCRGQVSYSADYCPVWRFLPLPSSDQTKKRFTLFSPQFTHLYTTIVFFRFHGFFLPLGVDLVLS